VEARVERAAARWDHLTEGAYNKAGVATEQQLEELKEQVRQLQWRVDRLTQRSQEPPAAQGVGEPTSEDLRSLA
jgi:predicted  nucleic acid-binding Zn-ribbon protein